MRMMLEMLLILIPLFAQLIVSLASVENCYDEDDTLITAHFQAHACDYRAAIKIILVTDHKATWSGATNSSRECLWRCARHRVTADCVAVSVYRNGNDVTFTCHLLRSEPTKDSVFRVDFLLEGGCNFYTLHTWGCSEHLSPSQATVAVVQTSTQPSTSGSGIDNGLPMVDPGVHELPAQQPTTTRTPLPPEGTSTTAGISNVLPMVDPDNSGQPPQPPQQATTPSSSGPALVNDAGMHVLPPGP